MPTEIEILSRIEVMDRVRARRARFPSNRAWAAHLRCHEVSVSKVMHISARPSDKMLADLGLARIEVIVEREGAQSVRVRADGAIVRAGIVSANIRKRDE